METDLVKTEQDWEEQSTTGKSRMGRKEGRAARR
jgi:hypothetical protein